MTGQVLNAVGFLSVIIGSLFCLASMIGIVRFPDVYARLHAGTKALTGGAVFIIFGATILYGSTWAAARMVLISAFLLTTNPIATHAIARACYRHGIKPKRVVTDHYGRDIEVTVEDMAEETGGAAENTKDGMIAEEADCCRSTSAQQRKMTDA